MMRRNQTAEILLVEDNPQEALLMCEVFKILEVPDTLHVVEDGEAALLFLRHRGQHASAPRPSLVLLDVRLPRRNGLEVLTEIKNDQSLKWIPVIVFSSSCDENTIRQAYQYHANCFIHKPADLDGLINVVTALEQFWLKVATIPQGGLNNE